MAWCDGPLLGFDLETTGVDTSADVPVQVALVWTAGGRHIRDDSWLVDPGREIPEAAMAIHGISSELARREGRSLRETASRIHAAVRRAAAEAIPVVAMNASFDVTIAEGLFAAFGLPPLAWHAVIDPLVMDRYVDRDRAGKRRLDALCEHYDVPLQRPHDARSDAAAAVGLARRIGARYEECGALEPEELTLAEAGWYGRWASEHDASCREQGLPGLQPSEFFWPCRRPPLLAVTAREPEIELARRRHPAFTSRSFTTRIVA